MTSIKVPEIIQKAVICKKKAEGAFMTELKVRFFKPSFSQVEKDAVC